MKKEKKIDNLLTCEKCLYTWYARKPKPRQCPNCKRQIKYEVIRETK